MSWARAAQCVLQIQTTRGCIFKERPQKKDTRITTEQMSGDVYSQASRLHEKHL